MGRPKKKHPGGRPTKMTPDTIGKLEQAFALGCPKTIACEYAGISRETLNNYEHKNPDFPDRIKQLQGLVGMQARKALANAIKKGDPKVAMDYLKRKYKSEFSEQHIQSMEVRDTNPVSDMIDKITEKAIKRLHEDESP